MATHGPLEQADFLERMGIGLRVNALLRSAKSDERRGSIEAGATRLVDRNGMGKEYKVLGVTFAPSPAGILAEQAGPIPGQEHGHAGSAKEKEGEREGERGVDRIVQNAEHEVWPFVSEESLEKHKQVA